MKPVPKPRRKTDREMLVEFFRSSAGSVLGGAGDYDDLTPAETAIRAMRELNALKAQHAIAKELLALWYAQAVSGQSVGRDTFADWTADFLRASDIRAGVAKFKRWLREVARR